MSGSLLVHLGANVYLHGRRYQDQWLSKCLEPMIEHLRSAGFPLRFWFDRFDARGPHLFILLSVPELFLGEVRTLLVRLLDHSLVSCPSAESLSPLDHVAFHQACRGKALCKADLLPELAPNNSYCLFEQESGGYPFGLSRHLPNQEELWNILDGVARDVLGGLSPDAPGRSTGLAVRWVASLDCSLQKVLDEPADFWRYHASTLFFAIDQLATRPEEEVVSVLSRSVGEKNQETFSRIWRDAEARLQTNGHLDRLAEIALTPIDRPERRWSLLREIIHCTLKQFGVPVPLHLPVVLFALCLHLSRHLERRKVSR